jgi:glycosyltransferase involved in cell wall biosynthesis
MRIAMVSTPFARVPPRGYGGTELVVDALRRALLRRGHEVALFATADSPAASAPAFFDRPVWPPDPWAEVLHCRAAARSIARERWDVVHAHVTGLVAFGDELGAPLVHTLHHAADPLLSRFYGAAPPPAVRVAISARQAALSAPPADAVVHHGLEPGLYPRVGRGGPLAFFLGRLSWVKGPELAVEAARRAGVPIVVAGSDHADGAPAGWKTEVLGPALQARHVTWLPRATLTQKRRLFARSRALLFPIRWEEPFGLVLIEAALAGCPVVAHRRGAVPEIVEDGVTGFVVDGVEEMADALRRAASLDRLEIQARARLRFSAVRMAARYEAVYLAAAGARPPTALRDAGRSGPEEEPWSSLAR